MRGNFSPTEAGRRRVAWRAILALAGCFPLAACGPQVIGQPKPPPEFGARKTKLVGCPSVEGLYAWPPVDGEYAKGMATNIRPWDGGRPVPVSRARMQIKVEQTGSRITMRSLSIDPPGVKTRAPVWTHVEYDSAQFKCKADMLEFEEVEYDDTFNSGNKHARRSFTLARLEDGSLAVGIKTTTTDGGGYIFSYDSARIGHISPQDKVFWSWSKLRPLDPASTDDPTSDPKAGGRRGAKSQ